MSAQTPGQAAYEAYVTFVGLPLSDWPWEANHALWDAVASTVAGNLADAYDAARKRETAAQQSRPAPELAAAMDALRDRFATLAASLDADALATQPSKKSQIQADAARRIREALA